MIRSTLFACLLLLALGCERTVVETTAGSLSGYAVLFDSTLQMSNSSGILVQVDDHDYSTTTIKNGQWTINDVPAGTYNLTVSKPGFGTYRYFGFSFVGNGTAYLPSTSIGKLPEGKVVIDSITFVPSYNALSIFGRTLDSELMVLIFVDTVANVQPSDPHMMVVQYPANYQLRFQSLLLHNQFSRLGLVPGQPVYISASTVNRSGIYTNDGAGVYFDPVHNQYHFTAPGPRSNVVRFGAP